jgi:hypothetical protein
MIMTLGYIFATILSFIGLTILYSILRGLLISYDVRCWQRALCDKKPPFTVFWKAVIKDWPDMIGIDLEDNRFSIGDNEYKFFRKWKV